MKRLVADSTRRQSPDRTLAGAQTPQSLRTLAAHLELSLECARVSSSCSPAYGNMWCMF